MRTMTKTLGWLVMAAALTFGFSACSSDDDAVAEKPTVNPAVTADGKVHVTVGAGISDGQTRTTVETTTDWDGTRRRTLKFTTGDRLYIMGSIESDDDGVRKMGGFVEVQSISEDGLSATFDGGLTVWKKISDWEWSEDDTNWAATQTGDPMTWYGTNEVEGWLVHADAVSELYMTTTEKTYLFQYEKSLATGATDNVSALMNSALYVKGDYNKTDNCFDLESGDVILNCTFSGLANGTYNVHFQRADSKDEYMEGNYMAQGCDQTVAVGDDGTARFAISIPTHMFNTYSGIGLSTNDRFYNCPLGQRQDASAKVYNISRRWNGEKEKFE